MREPDLPTKRWLEGYEAGYDSVLVDYPVLESVLAERLRRSGVNYLDPFLCRWDAAFRRFVVIQDGREWLI